MLELEANAIALGQSATNKDDAIEQVGQLLVSIGFMDAAYIDSMRGREAVANTLLGNGIAIPHGLQKDRDYIHRTGIAGFFACDHMAESLNREGRIGRAFSRPHGYTHCLGRRLSGYCRSLARGRHP